MTSPARTKGDCCVEVRGNTLTIITKNQKFIKQVYVILIYFFNDVFSCVCLSQAGVCVCQGSVCVRTAGQVIAAVAPSPQQPASQATA